MNNLKNPLAQPDDDLLGELLEAAQFALNDTRSANHAAAELDTPVASVKGLPYIAVQLSMEPSVVPEVSLLPCSIPSRQSWPEHRKTDAT